MKSKLTLILMGIVLISIVGAEIYSTPGFSFEPESISSDVSLTMNLEEEFTTTSENLTIIPKDLTEKTFPYYIAFMIIVTIAAIYVQTKYILKKRKERKIKAEGLTPNFVKGALDEMKNMEEPIEDLNVPEVEVVDKETKEEKFNDLVDELGLEEVKDKIEGVDGDE